MKNGEMEEKPLTEIQEKIVRIAAKKFAKNGYQKTSLGDIAKSVKISKGTLFYHYPSKEELFFIVLSKNIEWAFEEEFEFYTKQGYKLFQDRKKILEDLETFYDIRIAKPKLIEKLWLEGVIESEHNPKLRQMLLKKDYEIAQITTEMFKFGRDKNAKILEGFDDEELLQLAQGLAAFFRGMFLYKIMGKNPDEIKSIWIQTVYSLYSAKKRKNAE